MGKTVKKFSNKSKKEKKNAIPRKTKGNRRNNKRKTYRKKVKGGGPTIPFPQSYSSMVDTKNEPNLDNNYKNDKLYGKIIEGYGQDYDGTKELYEMIKNFKNIIIEFMNEINNSPKDITVDRGGNIEKIYNRLISQYKLLIEGGKRRCRSNQECRKLKARYYFCAWYWMKNILYNFIEIDNKLWIHEANHIIEIKNIIFKLNDKIKKKINEAFTIKGFAGLTSTVDSEGIEEFLKKLANLGNEIREEFINDKQLTINEEIKTKFSHQDPAMFVSNPLLDKNDEKENDENVDNDEKENDENVDNDENDNDNENLPEIAKTFGHNPLNTGNTTPESHSTDNTPRFNLGSSLTNANS